MAVTDAWSEAVRLGKVRQVTVDELSSSVFQMPVDGTESNEERKTDSMIVTVIAIRKPSLLEQQAGTGDVILAGPSALSAADRLSAVAQFGAKNADAINKAPAGLLVIELREGV